MIRHPEKNCKATSRCIYCFIYYHLKKGVAIFKMTELDPVYNQTPFPKSLPLVHTRDRDGSYHFKPVRQAATVLTNGISEP